MSAPFRGKRGKIGDQSTGMGQHESGRKPKPSPEGGWNGHPPQDGEQTTVTPAARSFLTTMQRNAKIGMASARG